MPAASADLRRRAKARFRTRPPSTDQPTTEAENRRLIHELRVHQIELELQNEELREVGVRLERSLERYADLYDFAPAGYFTLTGDGAIRELNLAGAALLGQERSRLIGRRLGLWVSGDSRPAFNAFLDRLVRGSFRETCEAILDLEGKPLRHVRFEGVGVGSGVDQRCRLVAMDITAQKRAEQELRAKEILLRTIMENSPDPIFMVDRANRLLYANPAALAVLNAFGRQPPWTPETLVGKTPWIFSTIRPWRTPCWNPTSGYWNQDRR